MRTGTILLVDDEPNNLRALKLDLEDTGYTLVTAQDGQQAWDMLPDITDLTAIMLDRMMPRMDGMQFMKQIKHSTAYSNIPVIMQTAAAEKEQVAEGIQAGVFYYLTKPYDKQVMLSVLEASIKDSERYRELRNNLKYFRSKLKLVRSSLFEVRTLEEAEYLATFLSQYFPDPERVVLGISELTFNALEHGNLGITYDEKTRLNNENRWESEIKRRQALPENKDKCVVIEFLKGDSAIELRIRDEGNGFNWEEYLEVSPERATHNHGRGIAMSRLMSFDEMQYIGCGNEVVCTVMRE